MKRGPEILLGLCQDDEEDIVHRGLVGVRNLTAATGVTGDEARQALKTAGGVATLKACLRTWSTPALLQIGVEALKPLVE